MNPSSDDLLAATNILLKMPVETRAVFALITEGYSQVEIAYLMGVRKNRISQLKLRARRVIVEKIQDEQTT